MQPCSVYSYVVYFLCLCMYTCSDFSGQRLFTGLDYWTGLLNWTRSPEWWICAEHESATLHVFPYHLSTREAHNEQADLWYWYFQLLANYSDSESEAEWLESEDAILATNLLLGWPKSDNKKNAYSGSSTHASSWISVEGDSLRPLSVSMSTWRVEWMTVFNHLLRHDYCQSYTSVTAGLYLYLCRNIWAFGTWKHSGSHPQPYRAQVEDGYDRVEKCAPGARGSDVLYLQRLHCVHPSNGHFKRLIALSLWWVHPNPFDFEYSPHTHIHTHTHLHTHTRTHARTRTHTHTPTHTHIHTHKNMRTTIKNTQAYKARGTYMGYSSAL